MATSAAASDQRLVVGAPATETARRRAVVLDLIALAVGCAIFLGISLYQLELPGLYPDEAFDVIPTMQILLGHSVELQRGAGIDLFGVKLPLMSSSDYQGVTSTYLAFPFFALGGINVYSLRFMTVVVGVVGLVLAFFLARFWFGGAAARLTVLLLCVSPAWIFWSRLGVYVVSEVVPIGTGALLALTVWARRRPLGVRNGPLYLGAFLLGLGLATKLLFLWMIAAVIIGGALLYGRRVWDERRTWTRDLRRWALVCLAALGAFMAGAFPFLLYNAMTRGTFNLVRYSLTNLSETPHGVDNTALVRNLWTEADAFRVLLDGSYFWFQGEQGRVYFNALTPSVFTLSALGLLALVLARRASGRTLSLSVLGIPASLLAVAAVGSVLYAAFTPEGIGWSVLLMALLIVGVVGIIWTAGVGLRSAQAVPTGGWALLIFGAVAGAAWWFGGAGRAEGLDPEGPLGLWPADLAGILFWLSGFALVLLLGFDRALSRFGRTVTAAVALAGLLIAQSTVTVSGLWSTHLLLVLPLPQIVIAAFAVELGRWVAARVHAPRAPLLRSGLRAAPALLLVGTLIVLDLAVDYSYHRDLTKTGGGSSFSDAIYSLASYLETQPAGQRIVAMDWGFKRPLQFLTQERVVPVEAHGYSPETTPALRQALREWVSEPSTLYLFHTPKGTAYDHFDAFTEAVRQAGKTMRLEKTFYHRDGVPVYLVYRVGP